MLLEDVVQKEEKDYQLKSKYLSLHFNKSRMIDLSRLLILFLTIDEPIFFVIVKPKWGKLSVLFVSIIWIIKFVV